MKTYFWGSDERRVIEKCSGEGAEWPTVEVCGYTGKLSGMNLRNFMNAKQGITKKKDMHAQQKPAPDK